MSLEEAGKLLALLESRGIQVRGLEKLDAGGQELTLLDLGRLGKRRVIVSVFPPGAPITVKTSRRAIEAADLIASDNKRSDDKVLVIIYSGRGKLTKTAYLYLGLAISSRGIDTVIVNGPPEEVVEVAETLKEKGRYVIDEQKVYPARW